MTPVIKAWRLYVWGGAGVPLFGAALAFDGLLTIVVWGAGGLMATVIFLKSR